MHIRNIMIAQLMKRRYENIYIFLGLILIVSGQELKILTPSCDRAVGQSIKLEITYPSDPSDTLYWNRPGSPQFASCEPTVSCSNPTGYNLDWTGFNYSITIDKATVAQDGGQWGVTDPKFSSFHVSLDLLAYHLPDVVVTCNPSPIPMITTGSPQTVTCSTECLDPGLSNLLFVLEDSDADGTAASAPNCSGTKSGLSRTITLNTFMELTGNKSLCYNLTSGQCSYKQQPTDCINVAFPPDSSSTSPPSSSPLNTPSGTTANPGKSGDTIITSLVCTILGLFTVMLSF